MNSTLLVAENVAKAAAFLLMAFIFVKNIRSELE
jgi:hypothetical protein